MLTHPFFLIEKPKVMTTYQYVALNNPQGAANMVQVYNLRPDRHPKALAAQMEYCVQRDGERARSLLSQIHPDFQLFQSQIENVKQTADKQIAEKESKLQELFSNMNGQAMKAQVENMNNIEGQTKNNRTELLMIGGIILIGLALVLKR